MQFNGVGTSHLGQVEGFQQLRAGGRITDVGHFLLVELVGQVFGQIVFQVDQPVGIGGGIHQLFAGRGKFDSSGIGPVFFLGQNGVDAVIKIIDGLAAPAGKDHRADLGQIPLQGSIFHLVVLVEDGKKAVF